MPNSRDDREQIRRDLDEQNRVAVTEPPNTGALLATVREKVAVTIEDILLMDSPEGDSPRNIASNLRPVLAALDAIASELGWLRENQIPEHWVASFDRLTAAEAELERVRPKVEAYDAARATVKIEGNTRAYYVLRAEAAEAELETVRAERDLSDSGHVKWKAKADRAVEALREIAEGKVEPVGFRFGYQARARAALAEIEESNVSR